MLRHSDGNGLMNVFGGEKKEDILGIFDPETFAFAFHSDDLQIDDLVGEIRAVAHRARKTLRNRSW